MNCTSFAWFDEVIALAIEAGVDYADLLSEPTPAQQAAVRAAGITAVSGLGATPGLSNVLVRHAADALGRARRGARLLGQLPHHRARAGAPRHDPLGALRRLPHPPVLPERPLRAGRIHGGLEARRVRRAGRAPAGLLRAAHRGDDPAPALPLASLLRGPWHLATGADGGHARPQQVRAPRRGRARVDESPDLGALRRAARPRRRGRCSSTSRSIGSPDGRRSAGSTTSATRSTGARRGRGA